VEAEVKRDVAWLRGKKAVLDVPVSGWVYDVKTGRVKRIV